MVGYTPLSFGDLVSTGERIEVGQKRGKSNHLALMNAKTGANEEDENEGETLVVTTIPTRLNFLSAQQCHYSANTSPSHPVIHKGHPQNIHKAYLLTTRPMPNTTFSNNQNTNQERNFAAEKPVEFTPISVSFVDLLPSLRDNSMVAITPAKVPQPPVF